MEGFLLPLSIRSRHNKITTIRTVARRLYEHSAWSRKLYGRLIVSDTVHIARLRFQKQGSRSAPSLRKASESTASRWRSYVDEGHSLVYCLVGDAPCILLLLGNIDIFCRSILRPYSELKSGRDLVKQNWRCYLNHPDRTSLNGLGKKT